MSNLTWVANHHSRGLHCYHWHVLTLMFLVSQRHLECHQLQRSREATCRCSQVIDYLRTSDALNVYTANLAINSISCLPPITMFVLNCITVPWLELSQAGPALALIKSIEQCSLEFKGFFMNARYPIKLPWLHSTSHGSLRLTAQ